jgi:hypothetical protein
VCSVSECDNEASLIQRTRSTRDCFAMEKYIVSCWVQKEICHAEILFILVVSKLHISLYIIS